MNEILLPNTVMPVLCGCDYIVASEPFLHADRIADFHILIYVTEGTIYVTEDEVNFIVGAGELLLLKSGVHHYGKIHVPRGTKWHYAHFTCPQEQLPAFTPDSSPIPQYTTIGCSLTLPKKLSGLAGSDIEHEISELIRYFHSDDIMRRWNLNPMLFSLLGKIGMYGTDTAQSPTLSDKICTYLSDSMRMPFSADAVSREFFLSYKHLAAMFKKEKGVTMQQYHTALRMNEACRLLRSTLLPVGEIATQLGYQDMLYFSRCFSRFNGMSPSEYRKLPPNY